MVKIIKDHSKLIFLLEIILLVTLALTGCDNNSSVVNTYSLSIEVVGEGAILDGNGDKILSGDGVTKNIQTDEDSTIVLTADPAAGWEFNEWLGDYESSKEQISIYMNQDKAITVVFNNKFPGEETDQLEIEESIIADDIIIGNRLQGSIRIKKIQQADIIKMSEGIIFEPDIRENIYELDTSKDRVYQDGDDLIVEFVEGKSIWDLRAVDDRDVIEVKILDKDGETLDTIQI